MIDLKFDTIGALDMCMRYPQVFKLLPAGHVVHDAGSWGKIDIGDPGFDMWIDSSHPEAVKFYRKYYQEIQMSGALQTIDQNNIKGLLAQNINSVKSVLPKHITPERMMRIAYTTITKTPSLARCSQASLINCVLEASMLGLEIGGPQAHCSLVPFKGQATLIVGYTGKMELAYRSGKVTSFSCHPVFENDTFSFSYGIKKDLVHQPNMTNRGKLIAAYAIAYFKNGDTDFEVIGKDEAMRAKKKSAGGSKPSSPWNGDDEPAMWVKTAVHRLCKRLPKSPEMQRVEDIESGKPIEYVTNNHVVDTIEDAQQTQTINSMAEPGLADEIESIVSEFPDEAKKVSDDMGIDVSDPYALTHEESAEFIKRISADIDALIVDQE